jgi:hypothetical protein
MRKDDLAQRAASKDPEVALTALGELRALLLRLEPIQVEHARRRGWSWERIGQALGITRQALHEKYAKRIEKGEQ